MNALLLTLALLGGPFRQNVQFVVPPAPAAAKAVADCPACPLTAPKPDEAPVSPSGLPPARVSVPVTVEVAAPAAPTPFPGPTKNPPRVLWVWDNGLVWEAGADVWRWQNADGTWNQK